MADNAVDAEPSSGAGPLTVEDRLEIFDVLARYNWAIDTDDAEAFVSTFAPGGEFVTKDRVYAGHDELRELMVYLHAKRDNSQRSLFHNVSNVVIEGDGEQVRFVAQLIGPRIADDGVTTLQLGWYDDRLAKVDGRWRFARRHFRPWPDTAPSASPVPFPAGGA